MGEHTNIQWTDHSWNPWQGCQKVSAGCKYCYMYRDKEQYHQDPSEVVLSKGKTFHSPLHYPSHSLIFACSWSDFFIEQADAWRAEAWQIIKACPGHRFQLVTKRPERIEQCLPADWGYDGYPNVWIIFSAEDQVTFEQRIKHVFDFPAAVIGVSIEPMLGPIDISVPIKHPNRTIPYTPPAYDLLDWVIIGGESGYGKIPEDPAVKYKYRVCREDWMENIVAACRVTGIPVFVKQMGTHLARELHMSGPHGGQIDEFPEALRVREFPDPDGWLASRGMKIKQGHVQE